MYKNGHIYIERERDYYKEIMIMCYKGNEMAAWWLYSNIQSKIWVISGRQVNNAFKSIQKLILLHCLPIVWVLNLHTLTAMGIITNMKLSPFVSTISCLVIAVGSIWCSRNGRMNAFPNTGIFTEPQLSAAQWTNPEAKSAVTIPPTTTFKTDVTAKWSHLYTAKWNM